MSTTTAQAEVKAGQELKKSKARERDVVGGQRRDEVHSSLKCRGHAGCSCTYQITTSQLWQAQPSFACLAVPHSTAHSHMYCIITHTSLACVWVSQQWTWSLWWSSREQHWNLQLVLQCGLLGQYPLSSSALPPPSLATSLPWLTSIGLLFLSNTCTLYSPFSFFLLRIFGAG